ncbi:Histidinol-phosphate aminotransferase, partial [Tolypocladium capitatum]
ARVAAQRERLLRELPAVDGVGRLRGGTEANFLLLEMLDARGRPDNATALAVYRRLAETQGVVVRFRGTEHGCDGCLRITVGTEDEVTRFLHALRTQLADVRGAGAVDGEKRRERDANGVAA